MNPLHRLGPFATLGALALLTACAVPVQPPITGYTCCNLRPDAGWITSNNVQGGAILPAGEPARFDSMKKDYYVYGSIGGRELALRDDSSRSKQETLSWARRIVVAEDPRLALAGWSHEIQSAVSHARVIVGMTRAQVLMSLGYPSRSDTPDLSAATWRYWTAAEDLPVDLSFDADDKLVRVAGKPTAVATIEVAR